MCNIQTAVSPHPLKIGHVYMNLFTWSSPYYHLLNYLLFLMKHPAYVCVCVCVCVLGYGYISARTDTTQQSGQTPYKEVEIKNITVLC
jgi:hypothetical protein